MSLLTSNVSLVTIIAMIVTAMGIQRVQRVSASSRIDAWNKKLADIHVCGILQDLKNNGTTSLVIWDYFGQLPRLYKSTRLVSALWLICQIFTGLVMFTGGCLVALSTAVGVQGTNPPAGIPGQGANAGWDVVIVLSMTGCLACLLAITFMIEVAVNQQLERADKRQEQWPAAGLPQRCHSCLDSSQMD